MDSLGYALIALVGLITMVSIYGALKGGTKGMLEREMNHNTIDADYRIETTRYIDFFKQIKRVDSIYVHRPSKTFQIKKNNRLSAPFTLEDIHHFNIEFNGQLITQHIHAPYFSVQENALPEEVDAGDWSISFTLKNKDHLILFDSYDAFMRVLSELSVLEEN